MISPLSSASFSTVPFPHVLSDNIFEIKFSSYILDWFEHNAPWILVEESFYEQYEFSLLSASIPTELKKLTSNDLLNTFKKHIEFWF